MSKIRSVRQCTDAPRQDEGPSTGAALLAGAVLGLATDAVALARPRQQARLLSAATLAAGATRGPEAAESARGWQLASMLTESATVAMGPARSHPVSSRQPTGSQHGV